MLQLYRIPPPTTTTTTTTAAAAAAKFDVHFTGSQGEHDSLPKWHVWCCWPKQKNKQTVSTKRMHQ